MKITNMNSPETIQQFESMMNKKPQGRLPEGTLNFHEVQEGDSNDTPAHRIYADLVRETKGMFDKKESGAIACQEAKDIAESIHERVTDKVQNRLLTDITMWTLVFGSCLDAYGLLGEVKSKSDLWRTVKERLQSTVPQAKGGWKCE